MGCAVRLYLKRKAITGRPKEVKRKSAASDFTNNKRKKRTIGAENDFQGGDEPACQRRTDQNAPVAEVGKINTRKKPLRPETNTINLEELPKP